MFKLDLEKAEEPGIKLPTIGGLLKKQESSRKTSISALLSMPKPLTVWITTNYGDNIMQHRKPWSGKLWSGFLSFVTLPSHLNFPASVSPLYKDNLKLDDLESPQFMLSFCLWVNFQIQSNPFYTYTQSVTLFI